ncbi:Rho GTPase activation protein (RhoGAP) with PH domain [Raphanus sativus]|uniref:Rho GTPase-activating protein REN1 isoform X2 n=1 Tax=Raphanus sativus TaxID=3726 RepID=A0A6J0MIS3_RAPSA|nr:rho GTPase-activating protein REN1 isoform X2 [Raphanus sativus]KAJ4913083.1 Rho GTPase activation protein (RhoGAP) with PH domain [Raphanus sativus]
MAPTKNSESSPQVQPPPKQQQNQQQQNNYPLHEQDLETLGDTCSIPQPGSADSRSHGGNTVFKTGPLSISSKGLGWTSWKKRWFILTRTSLVFFRSDPSAVQQRGGEVNLTLGGIDLNNSGSVVVKADKKLLTVLFPDGRDGRAFTLKADTMEDLQEWKVALESALTQAPNASHVMGQNGIFTNDHADAPVSVEEQKVETPTRSTVIGRPVLLALEDVDGSPSFLEKALRFVEDHGINVEGILRQAADVDDVEHRIREYEQGKNEFTPTEDAHVIADCLKYVLRELPSSPVPASCCNALLEACRTDRGNRVNAMREAICESFPEPNRRLLQRILTMMQVVASNKNVNRMNTNAVAACMAPLLLRPLLAGDCEIENDFDVGGDGSMQLLQAAAAANHAQAIVITLLEEYASIFGEGSLSPGLYSDSEESGSGTDEGTDDEEYDDDDDEYDGTQGSDDYTDEEEDLKNESNGLYSESAASEDNHVDDIDHDDHKARSYTKINDNLSSESKTPKGTTERQLTKKLSSGSNRSSLPRHDDAKKDESILVKGADNAEVKAVVEDSTTEDKSLSTSDLASAIKKPSTLSSPPGGSNKRWGRTPGKKNLPMESIDFAAEVEVDEDDADIERLESTKSELQNSISEEVKNNAALQASLERRKKALYVRREALEKDVGRLQEQLQQERNKKSALEAGLKMSKGNQPILEITDEKLKKDLQDVAQAEADIANLEHKVDDLENRLSQQDVKASGSTHGASKESRKTPEHNTKIKEKQKDTEAASTHVSERSSLKVEQGSARENEIEKQKDPRSKSSQQETSRGSSKLAGMSKRSGRKGEGNTTTSALSKLSIRLNFLKERRSQIASELSNMDNGKSTGQPSPSSVQNQSLQETERETGSNQNQSQEWQSSKLHSQHVLDRGRSENGGERGRGGSGGNQPSTTPRTFSR